MWLAITPYRREYVYRLSLYSAHLFADVGLLGFLASSTAFPAQGRGVGDPLFHVRFLCSTFFGGVFCYFAT
jgi:hypothetical protein